MKWFNVTTAAALALTGCGETPKPADPAPDPRPCNRIVEQSAREGLIRGRSGAELQVDERLWSAISARSKRTVAILARCSARDGKPGTESIVGEVTGYRTGKLLAMASRETTHLFD